MTQKNAKNSGKLSPADMLTCQEAADYLGKHLSTLARWRTQNRGPRYHRVMGSVRYRREDLENFVWNSAVNPGGLRTVGQANA